MSKGAIPSPSGPFLGRQDELEALRGRIADGDRLVTVTGSPGVGKTRLCIELARTTDAAEFPGGVFFCDLVQSRSAAGLVRTVAAGVGVELTRPEEDEGNAALLAASFARRPRTLVILDNLDRVVADAAVLLDWTTSSRSLFVATSREPLGLGPEVVLRLGPLSLESARLLFTRRSGAVEADDGETIDAILTGLDRNPLAIELVAAHVAVLGPTQLHEQLSTRIHQLRHPRRDLPPRSRSIEGALSVSWDLLEPWERTVLAQLTVFHGGFFLDAAEAVVDLSMHPDSPPVSAVVASLWGRSLVTASSERGRRRLALFENVRRFVEHRVRGGAPGRYRLSDRTLDLGARRVELDDGGDIELTPMEAELLRHLADRAGGGVSRQELLVDVWGYAPTAVSRAVDAMVRSVRKKIEPNPNRAVWLLSERGVGYRLAVGSEAASGAADRHAAFYARLGTPEAIDALDRHGGIEKLRLLELETRNLHAALDHVGVHRSDEAASIGMALLATARMGGPFVASAMLAGRLLTLPALQDSDRARLLVERGWAWSRAGVRDATRESFEAAVKAAQRCGDRRQEGRALACVALNMEEIGEDAEARRVFEAAREIHREVGDRVQEGVTEVWLGSLAKSRMDFDAAGRHFASALRILRGVGHRLYEGKAYSNRAITARARGWLAEAEEDALAAMTIYEEVGASASRIQLLANYGWFVALRRGTRAARAPLEEALARSKALDLTYTHAIVMGTMGWIELLEGRSDRARRLLRSAYALHEENGVVDEAVSLLTQRALAASWAGEPARALRLAEEAIRRSEIFPERATRGIIHYRVAVVMARAGAMDRARSLSSTGLQYVSNEDRPIERAESLVFSAWVRRLDGDDRGCRELLDEVRATLKSLGISSESSLGLLIRHAEGVDDDR